MVAAAKDASAPGVSGVLLAGYLGRGSGVGTARLYLDPSLASYLEFPVDAILSAKNPPEETPHRFSEVWLRPDAVVTHVETSRQQLQAEFLAGGIVEKHLSASKADPMYLSGAKQKPSRRGRPPRTAGIFCVVETILSCPSVRAANCDNSPGPPMTSLRNCPTRCPESTCK